MLARRGAVFLRDCYKTQWDADIFLYKQTCQNDILNYFPLYIYHHLFCNMLQNFILADELYVCINLCLRIWVGVLCRFSLAFLRFQWRPVAYNYGWKTAWCLVDRSIIQRYIQLY
jgi:hypothetical protein